MLQRRNMVPRCRLRCRSRLPSRLRKRRSATTAPRTALGQRAGVTPNELEANRRGRSVDPRVAAARQFAPAVLDERGGVSDDALAEIRAAGFSDGEIAEIVAHVAPNVFTNYFNRVAQTEIDFPRVVAGQAAA